MSTSVYFIFWNMLIQLAVTSLVKGMVWEVFAVVENSGKEHNKQIEEKDKLIEQRNYANKIGFQDKQEAIHNYEQLLIDVHESFHSTIMGESAIKHP